jgi:CheY-like chemotaxis protein
MEKLNKILFVDDDAHTNEYHEYVSKRANVAVETLSFTSGPDALVYLSSLSATPDFPQLIFIDIKMSGMDGHDFVHAVKKLVHFDGNHTQLAYLTTNFRPDDVAAFAVTDMRHFYFKTITDFDLKNIVKEIFEG